MTTAKCKSPVGCWIEHTYDAEKCDCIYNSLAKRADDPVNNPAHYHHGGIETIDIIRTMLTPEEFIGYCKGNIIKYRERAQFKGKPDEDYAKAKWYHDRLKEEVSDE